MTTATPIPAPDVTTSPAPGASPPTSRRPRLLWFAIGGVLAIVAVVVAGFVFFGGGDEAALVNDHSAQAREPALIEVPGYAYSNPDLLETSNFDASMTQTNDQAALMLPNVSGDVYTAWSLHDVATADNDSLAQLGLMEANQQLTSAPGFDPQMVVSGVAGGMASAGATVTTETIDGETVAVAEGPDGMVAFAWYHDGTVCMAMGQNRDDVQTFVEAYVAEQNG